MASSRAITSLLWRSQRIYQVFGANTDVGKTIFTTLLCKAARTLWANETVTFLKPVSTGPDDEADDRYVKQVNKALASILGLHLNESCVCTSPLTSRFESSQHIRTGCLHRRIVQATDGVYSRPVHPDMAAQVSLSGPDVSKLPTDNQLLAKCQEFATDLARRQQTDKGWLFLETAGGVHSPTPSGTTQADLYTPLRVPAILVGDARLGGISQTVSAFESLHIRGYDVASVLLFEDDKYGNLDYLTNYFRDRYENVLVAGVAEPPARHANQQQDFESMRRYYTAYGTEGNTTKTVLERLDQRHEERVATLESMANRAHRKIWWPFCQHTLLPPEKITVIDSAHGDYFQTLVPQKGAIAEANGQSAPATGAQPTKTGLLRSSFDGSASWWTQGLGHGNPRLTLAAAHAAGRYGHVMFADAMHAPALALAEKLLRGVANPRLTRVFFSDNGSTGVEVAIKMALRATRVRYHPHEAASDKKKKKKKEKLGILGLKGSYHGDTMGAMDSSEPCAYNEKTEWYQGRGYWFDYPTILCADGKWQTVVPGALEGDLGRGQVFDSLNDMFDVAARESRNEHIVYETYIQKTLQDLQDQGQRFGALILEPIVLGAGGMALVDPLFQRALVNVVRRSPHLFQGTTNSLENSLDATNDPYAWTGLPVIFDEVFTGIYRLGRFTAASFLGVHPDISVHAKLLTGGLVPLCTTLASESIFRTFSGSQDKTDALLHGHSYTAHPIGCQVAVESLKQMVELEQHGHWDWAKRNGWIKNLSFSSASRTAHADREASSLPSSVAADQPSDAQRHPVWSVWPLDFVHDLSGQTGRVMGVWALGSVLAIHLKDQDTGYVSNAAVSLRNGLLDGEPGASWNVHCRVLGNVLYLMAGQTTTKASVDDICRLLIEKLN